MPAEHTRRQEHAQQFSAAAIETGVRAPYPTARRGVPHRGATFLPSFLACVKKGRALGVGTKRAHGKGGSIQKKNEKKRKKKRSTGPSRVVPHRSTTPARNCLTSLLGWEAVSQADMAALISPAGTLYMKATTLCKSAFPTPVLKSETGCGRTRPLFCPPEMYP